VVADVTTTPSFRLSEPRQLAGGGLFGLILGGSTNTRQLDSAPDGRVVAVLDTSAGPPPATGSTLAPPQFVVVTSWFEELKARVH
jgi:hypothetical protein